MAPQDDLCTSCSKHIDSICSHYLNNSTSEILIYTSNIRAALGARSVDVNKIIKNLNAIEAESRVIRDMGSPFRYISIGLNEAVESWYCEESFRIVDKGIQLKMDLADRCPSVRVNWFWLKTQVIGELVTNSVAAFSRLADQEPPFEPQIHLQTLARDNTAMLIVSDNGPGIDPALVDHLLSDPLVEKADGHGRGLRNARRIMEWWGGSLVIGPPANPGAVIVLTFPAYETGVAEG